MTATILTNDVRTNSAIITYDTIERTYYVKTYKDGRVCCRCEFPAYEDEDGVEPIIFAHWIRAATDGTWRYIRTSDIEKGFEPICSHCGKRFGLVALDYRRCPNCGAHMRKVDGDEY